MTVRVYINKMLHECSHAFLLDTITISMFISAVALTFSGVINVPIDVCLCACAIHVKSLMCSDMNTTGCSLACI